MKKNKYETYTIICQVENWDLAYHLWSDEFKLDHFLSDNLNINAKVILSESKNITLNDDILFRFSIEPVVDYNIECPKCYGSFNKSKKQRECFMGVPNNFIERFCFLINQNIKPYFILSCRTGDYRTIEVKSFYMHSRINLEDYME